VNYWAAKQFLGKKQRRSYSYTKVSSPEEGVMRLSMYNSHHLDLYEDGSMIFFLADDTVAEHRKATIELRMLTPYVITPGTDEVKGVEFNLIAGIRYFYGMHLSLEGKLLNPQDNPYTTKKRPVINKDALRKAQKALRDYRRTLEVTLKLTNTAGELVDKNKKSKWSSSTLYSPDRRRAIKFRTEHMHIAKSLADFILEVPVEKGLPEVRANILQFGYASWECTNKRVYHTAFQMIKEVVYEQAGVYG